MRMVSDMIKQLQTFPPDATCYAYEGEVCGLVIVRRDSTEKHLQEVLGVIYANECDEIETKVDKA